MTVKNLIEVEHLLLEIENRFKFDLTFSRLCSLYIHQNTIGEMTDLLFTVQEEYYDKFKDEEKLKEYHDKLMNDEVDIDISKPIKFIETIRDIMNDSEFNDLVNKKKFW